MNELTRALRSNHNGEVNKVGRRGQSVTQSPQDKQANKGSDKLKDSNNPKKKTKVKSVVTTTATFREGNQVMQMAVDDQEETEFVGEGEVGSEEQMDTEDENPSSDEDLDQSNNNATVESEDGEIADEGSDLKKHKADNKRQKFESERDPASFFGDMMMDKVQECIKNMLN